MGKCNSTSTTLHKQETSRSDVQPKSELITQKVSEQPVYVLPEKFQDFPEIPDKYVGEGIRKLKAYKSSLRIDEIQKLREDFWSIFI